MGPSVRDSDDGPRRGRPGAGDPSPIAEAPSAAEGAEPGPPPLSAAAIFLRFLRFGALAWGGPVAQIAMVRQELVEEQKWLSRGRFNRLLAVYQVLPGPEAHELCVHMGMLAGRRLGGFLAGLGFMLPGFVLMFALSWLYLRLGLADPALAALFLGVQAGVMALILRAVHRIGEHVLVGASLWLIGAASAAAAWAGAPFWIALPAAGGLAMLLARRNVLGAAAVTALAAAACLAAGAGESAGPLAAGAAAGVAQGSVAAPLLFLSGLKAGLLTFGGAYTVIPFLRGDAVGSGWMTDAQFLDGLALSSILPAPLIIFSTFVGYYAGGPFGALAMTAGIFLPAFAFTLLFHDRLERAVGDERLHLFLEGVAAGVVGLIAATLLDLGVALAGRVPSLPAAGAIFAAALALLYLWKSKLSVVVVVAASGAAGYAAFA